MVSPEGAGTGVGGGAGDVEALMADSAFTLEDGGAAGSSQLGVAKIWKYWDLSSKLSW